MPIADRVIDQAFADLKKSCGGVRSDYFGLLYLEQEFGVERDRVFLRLADPHAMYKEMGERFVEHNIRSALPEDEAVNRSIQQSIRRTVLDGNQDARVFRQPCMNTPSHFRESTVAWTLAEGVNLEPSELFGRV